MYVSVFTERPCSVSCSEGGGKQVAPRIWPSPPDPTDSGVHLPGPWPHLCPYIRQEAMEEFRLVQLVMFKGDCIEGTPVLQRCGLKVDASLLFCAS
jgi:hypothetical protein